jgi:hypothetical protein
MGGREPRSGEVCSGGSRVRFSKIDFLNGEIAILERGIAEHALHADAIKRLMTVPGVSLMTASTFIAAVGGIRRFHEPRKLVSYLGLDPKVRQSGIGAARHGRISKQGAAQVRQMFAEAAFVAVSTAGPMRVQGSAAATTRRYAVRTRQGAVGVAEDFVGVHKQGTIVAFVSAPAGRRAALKGRRPARAWRSSPPAPRAPSRAGAMTSSR